MLNFVKIMTRSKEDFSDIKVAIIELEHNGKSSAIVPLEMPLTENTHSELVVAVVRSMLPKSTIYLLPNRKDSFDFIRENNIPIVNMSLSHSGVGYSKEKKLSKSAFLVTSSGNDGSKGEYNSATKESWCAVGAINRKRVLQPYSSFGKGFVKVVSYSGEIVNGVIFHGTSASAPVVFSLLSQWYVFYFENLKRYPSAKETYLFIERNIEDIGSVGFDLEFGYGNLVLPLAFDKDSLFEIKEEKCNFLQKIYSLLSRLR